MTGIRLTVQLFPATVQLFLPTQRPCETSHPGTHLRAYPTPAKAEPQPRMVFSVAVILITWPRQPDSQGSSISNDIQRA